MFNYIASMQRGVAQSTTGYAHIDFLNSMSVLSEGFAS